MPNFDPNLSLGAQSPEAIAQYLDLLGDTEGARAIRRTPASGQGLSLPGLNAAWKSTGMRVGYIPPEMTGRHVAIQPASEMGADPAVRSQRVKVTLDGFFVHELPGFGMHKVLCEFSGKNQASNMEEEVRFSLAMRVHDGAPSAVRGAPIFVNLEVGENGLSFEGRIINVENDGDEWLLKALESEAFKSGLSLLNSTQPVLRPFTSLAASAVGAVVAHRKNQQVFSFNLGLDFSSNVTATRMRLGSYVIVQSDDQTWSWTDVRLDRETNVVVDTSWKAIPFNHFAIGVSLSNPKPI